MLDEQYTQILFLLEFSIVYLLPCFLDKKNIANYHYIMKEIRLIFINIFVFLLLLFVCEMVCYFKQVSIDATNDRINITVNKEILPATIISAAPSFEQNNKAMVAAILIGNPTRIGVLFDVRGITMLNIMVPINSKIQDFYLPLFCINIFLNHHLNFDMILYWKCLINNHL